MSAGIISGISIAGAGIIFCIIAILFFAREKTLINNCTCRTTGKIVKYRRGGANRATWISPMVEFTIGGKTYHAFRHYKATKVIITNEPHMDVESGKYLQCYVDDKDVFHRQICHNPGAVKKSVEEIWPIGSDMTVIYNPQKPSQAFVDKVVSISNIAGIVFVSCGAGFIALGILLACLLG